MTTLTLDHPVEQVVHRPLPDLEALFPGKYLSVTSFKRDGTAVDTPVWFVTDDNRLYALTDLHSGKIRRIRRHPRVLVAPCSSMGKLRRPPIPAEVEVLTDTADLDRVQRLLRNRYRVSYPLVMWAYRLGRRLHGDPAVAEGAALAITVDGPEA